jgi:hypothetical protein
VATEIFQNHFFEFLFLNFFLILAIYIASEKKARPKYLRFLKWVAFSFREIGTIPFPVEKILAEEEEEEVPALPTTAKSS